MNSLPNPRPLLRASTLPPCSSVRPLTNARPIPRPPSERPFTPSICENISNIPVIDSGAIPIPSSFTDSDSVASWTEPVTSVWLPGSLYFAAFVRRFDRICDRRRGSASSRAGSSGRLSESCWFLPFSVGRAASTAASTTSNSDTSLFLSCSLPWVMRAMSSRSSSSSPMCVT